MLTEILQRPDVDSYDLLAHLAFDEGLHSREERAVALFNLHQDFFATYNAQAREVLRTLVERYVQGGVDEVLDPKVFHAAADPQGGAPGRRGLRRHEAIGHRPR